MNRAGAGDGRSEVPALAAALDGVQLIEASAGTGKTWTIAALYLRLILERDLRSDQILVVTFTEAATAELRERIRDRLVEAEAAFAAAGPPGDPLLAALRARHPDTGAACGRLARTLRAFDEAAIHTIHGYAGRVLADSAFESALPFDAELVADDADLAAEVAADFFRRRVGDGHPLAVRRALARGLTPAPLQRLARGPGANPRLPVLAEPADAAPDAAAARMDEAATTVRTLWAGARAEIEDTLARHPGLNHNSYKPANVRKWCAGFDAAVGTGDALALATFEHLVRFTPEVLAEKGSGKSGPPRHPLFDACAGLRAALAGLDSSLRAVLAEFVAYCRAELPRRKHEARRRSYDDLLLGLQGALAGTGGKRLSAALRERHPAALIDEFQDTDPLQYEIFRRIYAAGGGVLFMVGDAKQAIYSFRGADVFAYLAGQAAADGRHALRENRRSDPPLVDAYNALFDFPGAFALADIGYERAIAAPPPRPGLQIAGDPPAACVLWRLPWPEPDRFWSKEAAAGMLARATAAEIARLLAAGAAGTARIGERPLAGGDIAVLVRSHHQAQRVRDALRAAGIATVEIGRRSVLASPLARELDCLLAAVAAPRHDGALRAALGTSIVGLDAAAVAALAGDEAAWQAWHDRFGRWHVLWREHGCMRMLAAVDAALGVAARLLARPDGERCLTDLRHLAELLQTRAAQVRAGIEPLRDWYAGRLADAGDREREEEQLRLESDADLVRIVTIHRAKGLQYPIVFSPYLWDGARREDADAAFVWHDPGADRRAVLDLRFAGRAEALEARRREEHAESLRLFYVAVTRAVHRLYLGWGRINEAGTSPAAWFLLGRELAAGPAPIAAVDAHFRTLDAAAETAALAALAARANGAVRIEPAPAPVAVALAALTAPQTRFAARAPRAVLPAPWRVTSYTGLAAGAAAATLIEAPDHDALARPPQPETEPARGIHAFPRGARPGSCLHAIFERIDFAAAPQALAPVVERGLDDYGYGREWTAPLTAQIARVLATPVTGDGLPLAAIGAGRRLSELEFHLPLAPLSVRALRGLLAVAGAPFAPEFSAAAQRLDFAPVHGLLKGYVDLVFEAGGRWYVADWKSNWLGPDAGHYTRERMLAVMAHEHYYLQYLLYTVALHRYLRRRLPDYAYERHVGGACYLFVRGMDPGRPGSGVFFDRPAAALVAALDRLFAGA